MDFITMSRIVIIGGGFAGVKCASTLRKQLPKDLYEVVLFNKENHMVFHPLLAEVVGASLSPEDVIAPLRQMLPGVHCRTEDVKNIDLSKNMIEYEGYDSSSRFLSFDHVVIACGGVVNLGTIPGMSDHAFPMKTIGDAINLRAHIMQQFEKAEVCDDPLEKLRYLSFIVVGGGYSGVEVAGEINDLAKSSRRFFQNIKEEDISISLIHSQNQLLPEIGEELRVFAGKKLQDAGIKVMLNSKVAVATPEGVGLSDGKSIMGGTIVCTIGTKIAPIVEKLNVPKKNGRLVTKEDMSLVDYKNIWAIGDCAQIVNSFDGKLSPPTGQFAERQGRQVAQNIVRSFLNQPTKPFYFRPLGQLCSLGGHQAVAEMFGVKMSGFLAWFLWRGVYLFKLPSWSRRVKAGFDWAWQLVFSKDLSHLKTNVTERISHAHYEAGDYIFRQGDPASCFYIIEKGEVEVIKENGKTEVVAVLGQGSYFGEMALLNDNPRNASVRAKSSIEVIVMGRKIFKEISNSLGPLNHALIQSINRRTADVQNNDLGNPRISKAELVRL
jgi:NADH dehydrogenase